LDSGLTILSSLKGLYVILDESRASLHSLEEVLQKCAGTEVTLVQYRNKTGSGREAYQHAVKLQKIAVECGVPFLINDRCDLALAVEADGVHLGQSDLPLALARDLLGPNRIIGISTHRKEEVVEATMGGADYIGFGPIFPTLTKANHDPVVGIEGLQHIRSLTSLPIFAIGGITPRSVPSLIEAGANGVAVASAILNAQTIQQAIRDFTKHFHPGNLPIV
jgi:thiamine-phosphate pyrophosphorylase